ncbi:hypothetical protein PAXINDRAFT_90028 [Paxillus involutus ATCC 200175]|uniref:WD40 repeat-like protein n=1 Tax=Paxillus involutus ATCC 200175 TaxID=664439 RepID=A0A0C9TIF0_PAXIN|nr:hypothetical protein PAXINDRAFT_90028 [Paxillus involutus ATCC 200175]
MSNTSPKSTDRTAKPFTTISAHKSYIRRIAYLPGGERAVTCSYDGTVRIWDVEKGVQEGRSMMHGNRVRGLAVTSDGKRILSGGEDKRIRVWDVDTQQPIEELGSHTSADVRCLSLSPDGRLAASGDSVGNLVIREMKMGGETKHSIHAGSEVYSLGFSPNGEKLACASEDRTIRCWDSETGESIGKPWTGHMGNVFSLSLSPDGTKVASASWDKTVRLWDTNSGDPIGHPLQHEAWLLAVTFSPSGEFVTSGGSDGKVSIWRVPWWESQKQVIVTLTHRPTLYSLPQAHRSLLATAWDLDEMWVIMIKEDRS